MIPNQIDCPKIRKEGTFCLLFFEIEIELHTFNYFKISYVPGTIPKPTRLDFSAGENEESFFFDNGKGIKIASNLRSFTYINDGKNFPFKLSYKYYKARRDGAKSGHYIFGPTSEFSEGSKLYSKPTAASIYMGNLFAQITV